jgi:hypothetical protein
MLMNCAAAAGPSVQQQPLTSLVPLQFAAQYVDLIAIIGWFCSKSSLDHSDIIWKI